MHVATLGQIRTMQNGGAIDYRERILSQRQAGIAAAAKIAGETARRAALTPAERLAEDAEIAAKAEFMAEKREMINAFKSDYAKTIVPQYTVAGPGPLNEREKYLQKIITADIIDFDALFRMIPLAEWNPRWQMGKYRFIQRNGVRNYIPWTEQNLADFIYGPYFTTQPGYTCPESQLDQGLIVHWGKQQAHKLRYPVTDWKHIWPMYPGGGYPGQVYGCEKYRPSTWVKIRKFVYIAVAIVAAVYLGPIVLEKIASMMAQGMSGLTGGAVGGGTAGGATTAVEATGFIAKVNKAVAVYNKLNTVAHIVQGKIPPPPVGITGATFKAVAINAVKQEIKNRAIDEAMKAGIKYIEKKMTVKEEAKLRAEISELQRKMDALVPKDTPMMPSPLLPPEDREKIAEIQTIQRKREQDTNTGLIVAAAGVGLFLLAG